MNQHMPSWRIICPANVRRILKGILNSTLTGLLLATPMAVLALSQALSSANVNTGAIMQPTPRSPQALKLRAHELQIMSTPGTGYSDIDATGGNGYVREIFRYTGLVAFLRKEKHGVPDTGSNLQQVVLPTR